MKCKYLTLLASMGFAAFLLGPSPALAATAPPLGTAANFAVLGGTAVTCDNPFPPLPGFSVTGDVGSKTAVTGFPGLCKINGSIRVGGVATTAWNDVFVARVGHAYYDLVHQTCTTNLTGNVLGTDAGAKTLAPGVYCFDSTAQLTGTLTLAGPPNGIWVFQIGSGITTGTASVVMNGGQACNVFWQVTSQATIGTGTAFQGNILAGTAIVFSGTNSSLVGRALAGTGVTMTGTNISIGNCGGTQPPSCKPDKKDKKDKHDKDDKQNCDGNHDGHDQDDQDDDDEDDHDGGDQHDHHGG